MSKHTPGPWSVVETPIMIHIAEADNYTIATTKCLTSINNERANARLIAAAPEMLEFLDDLERNYDCQSCDGRGCDWCEELSSLIRKAKGE